MRVLMIEDERDTAEALSWDLTAEGYVVDLAGNGVDGLWKATENACPLWVTGNSFHAE